MLDYQSTYNAVLPRHGLPKWRKTNDITFSHHWKVINLLASDIKDIELTPEVTKMSWNYVKRYGYRDKPRKMSEVNAKQPH